jgi:hypothetical protein
VDFEPQTNKTTNQPTSKAMNKPSRTSTSMQAAAPVKAMIGWHTPHLAKQSRNSNDSMQQTPWQLLMASGARASNAAVAPDDAT